MTTTFPFAPKAFDAFRDHTTERLEAMRDDLAADLAAHAEWLTTRTIDPLRYAVTAWTPSNAGVRGRMLYRIGRELSRRAHLKARAATA